MSALSRNDLLPPRPDDKIKGQIGQRFIVALERSMKIGDYEPSPAVIVPVTKPKHSTRPAALLNLADRVVFQALVDRLSPRIERGLVSDRVVVWPRATSGEKRWSDFQDAPLVPAGEYVVRADVAGFYESVDHQILQRTLVALTGRAEVVDLLGDFLGRVMGAPRGLPQGLGTSDVLATAYLGNLDAEMLRAVHHYWRHGDDIRVTASDYDAACRAIHVLEEQLRKAQLLLNAGKTLVLHRDTYERQLRSVGDRRKAIQREMLRDAVVRLADSSDFEIDQMIERTSIGHQMFWQLVYDRGTYLDELADLLRRQLDPDQVEVASAIFEDALRRAPDTYSEDALEAEEFHSLIAWSLTVFLAAKDPLPIGVAVNLIRRFPDKTENVATYLRGVAATHPTAVVAAASAALSSGYLLGSQKAWLLTVLRHAASASSRFGLSAGIHISMAIVNDEEESWLARVEAARLLAEVEELTHDQLSRIWNRAPVAVRVDLAAAISRLTNGQSSPWANAFRDSLKADPLLQAMLHHEDARHAQLES
jgi:hypothetical protein